MVVAAGIRKDHRDGRGHGVVRHAQDAELAPRVEPARLFDHAIDRHAQGRGAHHAVHGPPYRRPRGRCRRQPLHQLSPGLRRHPGKLGRLHHVGVFGERGRIDLHAACRVLLRQRVGRGGRARPGVEQQHARRGAGRDAVEAQRLEFAHGVGAEAECQHVERARRRGQGLGRPGAVEPVPMQCPQLAQVGAAVDHRREQHQPGNAALPCRVRTHRLGGLHRKACSHAQPAQHDAFHAGQRAQLRGSGDDARGGAPEKMRGLAGAGGVAGARIVKAQHRHAGRGEIVGEMPPCAVRPHGLVAQRRAQHYPGLSLCLVQPAGTAFKHKPPHVASWSAHGRPLNRWNTAGERTQKRVRSPAAAASYSRLSSRCSACPIRRDIGAVAGMPR
ncbi:hypothetical protein CUTA107171_20160 [Cupriavidus taiwanensis]